MLKFNFFFAVGCATALFAIPVAGQTNVPESRPNPIQNQKAAPDASTHAPEEKVAKRPKFPTLKVSGNFSLWAGTGFGEALGGNFPNRNSRTPPGRNFGGNGTEVFKLRRGNLNFRGDLLPALDYKVQVNVSKFGTESGSVLQELWLGYRLSPELRVEIGRQKTGLTEEGTRPSARLLTIARSLMNESIPAKSGRVGNARATGAVLRYQTGRINSFVGIWDGNGENDGLLSSDRFDFLDAGIFVKTLRRFTFGVWGGRRISRSGGNEKRDRAGATMLFESGAHTFEIEGAYARDAGRISGTNLNGSSLSLGFYILYAYKVSKQWQIVGRYDVWDPAQRDRGDTLTETGVLVPQGDHKLKEYTVGVNYYASKNVTFQLNYIREDTEQNGGIYFGKPRTILLSAARVTF